MDDNTAKVLETAINAIPALIGGLGSLAAAYFAFRSKQTSAETKVIALNTERNTNGMKDELIHATKVQYYAAGKLSEKTDPGNVSVAPPPPPDPPVIPQIIIKT